MKHFFYRFDFLSLIAGNKSSGFITHMCPDALRKLQKIQVDQNQIAVLHEQIHEKLKRAQLLPAKQVKRSGVVFSEGSACPLYFTTDPVFGGSIGARPDDLINLRRQGAPEEGLEEFPIEYTPHNIDTPKQALALVVMIETWGEWAFMHLLDIDRQDREASKAVSKTTHYVTSKSEAKPSQSITPDSFILAA